MDLIILFFQ